MPPRVPTSKAFARYMDGFTKSAEVAATVTTIARDIAFCVAVGAAVVVAAPADRGGQGGQDGRRRRSAAGEDRHRDRADGKASAEFQASLGKTRDTFLQLRKDYLAAKAGSAARKEVMAKVPDAIAPWLDAVEKTAQKLRDEAKDAGFDPDKLDAGALRKEAGELDAIVAAGDKLRATYSSDPTQMLAAKHEAQVSGWETKLGIKTDPTVERLTSDATLLFGYSANKTEDGPPLAQLVESGFFSPGKPGATGDDRGNFDAKFIQEMARHGFDTGTAWSGAFTDSMHFELVTNVSKARRRRTYRSGSGRPA